MPTLQQLKIEIAKRLLKSVQESRATEATSKERAVSYDPTTEFGRKMLSLRRKVEESGVRLLSPEEVLEEVKARRGGID